MQTPTNMKKISTLEYTLDVDKTFTQKFNLAEINFKDVQLNVKK